eukprot:403367076
MSAMVSSDAQMQDQTQQHLTIEQIDQLNQQLEQSESAFAKLVCNNDKVFYMTELEFEIGREVRPNDPKYFCLAETGTLSKNHAKIFWDKEKKSFMIQNLSKNKVSYKEKYHANSSRRITNIL